MITADPSKTVVVEVRANAAEFKFDLAFDGTYRFVSTQACWIAQGSKPAAAEGKAGAMPVAAGEPVYLRGHNGARVSVVGKAGFAALTPVTAW